MPADQRPTETECPPWCATVHDDTETAHVSHRSDPWPVAVVERRTGRNGEPFDRVAATELAVGAESRWGDTWIWITPEDDVRRGLVLTRECAQRLVRALVTVFEEATP